MSQPTIAWHDDFETPYIRRLVLTIPAEWYMEQHSDRRARVKISWWLIKMAWCLLRTGRFWK